jgi:hypothetical protein
VQVLDGLQGREGADLVRALAAVTAHTSMAALGRGIASATSVTQALGTDTNWPLLTSVWRDGSGEGAAIHNRVCEALQADDLVTSLPAALKRAEREATDILTRPAKPPVAPPRDPDVLIKPPNGQRVVKKDSRQGVTGMEAKALLAEIQTVLGNGVGKTLNLTYEILAEDDGR